tara:strand:- start:77 stop:670 length:594 start_codon:yes stop_codon:yes gene_type:complete
MLPQDKRANITIIGNEISVNEKKYSTINRLPGENNFSNIYITYDKQYVFKKVTSFIEYNVFERDVYLLNYLNSVCDFVPKLINYDEDRKIIMMSYCGSPLTELNKNIIDQMKNMEETLKMHNVKHNDIKIYEEILILNNKLYLCDFGWGSIGNDHSCNIGLWSGKKPFGYVNFNFNPPKFSWDNDIPKFYDNMENTV